MPDPGQGRLEGNRLRAGAVGVGAVTFFVVSAAGPLVAIAGGFPLAMLFGDGPGMPAMLLGCTGLLLVFAAGYTALARHVVSAGGFYAFAARGLGGIAGGAAALTAVVAYNAMQVGIYGMFGSAARSLLLRYAAIAFPWYGYALLAVVTVAVLGYRQVDLSARILSVLVCCEYVGVLILDVAIVLSGGAHGITFKSFTPAAIFSGSPSIALLFCFAAFMGFEATTIYGEEARDAEHTIPRATYLAILLIGGFYVISLWCLIVGSGAAGLVAHLRGMQNPTRFLFELADQYVGRWLSATMSVLFVTSVFAGLLAFHNAAARYFYVLGRDGLLPSALGRTHARHLSPHVGSVLQTAIALVVVGAYAALGANPLLSLFACVTNVGTLGVIALMALSSVAVLVFFSRRGAPTGGFLRTRLAPALAAAALFVVLALAVVHFDVLTGSKGVLRVLLPSIILAAGGVGALGAWRLRKSEPERYRRLGLGGFGAASELAVEPRRRTSDLPSSSG